MDVHKTLWSEHDQGVMTGVPGDVDVTKSQNDQPRRSNSQDSDWANIISSCLQNSNACMPSDSPDLNMFNIGVPSQFNSEAVFSEPDPDSAATSNPWSSPVCDSNGALQLPYQQPWHVQATQLTGADPSLQSMDVGSWGSEPFFEQGQDFDMLPHYDGVGAHVSPTSHPMNAAESIPTSHPFFDRASLPVQPNFGHEDPWEQHEPRTPQHEDYFVEDVGQDRVVSADPCYAQLLFECLRDAPNHTMSLREIYSWVAQHSQKAKDSDSTGWKNSVRHNLSMNAAFERVPHNVGHSPKKASLWRVTDDALQEGVISTTRYRKDPKRKLERRSTPALNRQASGAKGGRATRDATRFRQQQHHSRGFNGMAYPIRTRRPPGPYQTSPYSPYASSAEASPQPGLNPHTPVGSPYFLDDPFSLPLPLSAPPTPLNQRPLSTTSPSEFHMPVDHKSTWANFESLPLDYSQGGVFGNHDPEMYRSQPPDPDSHAHAPHPMTETGFATHDGQGFHVPSNIDPNVMRDGDANGMQP